MTRTDLDTILAEIISDVLASGVHLGNYQRAVLQGRETWSGSSLRGKARQWGGRYRIARDKAWDLLAAEADRRGYDLRMAGGTAKEGPQRPVLVERA